MRKLRAAVIGVGYLGRYHAEKYAACKGVELVGVADTNEARAREIAARHGCRAVTDFREARRGRAASTSSPFSKANRLLPAAVFSQEFVGLRSDKLLMQNRPHDNGSK